MNRDLWRYARQVQVIGEPAQRAVLAARATVHGQGDGLAETLEALYLAGAGIGALAAPPPLDAFAGALNGTIRVTSAPALAPEQADARALGDGDDDYETALFDGILDETARSAASGALRALSTLAKVIR